jgi:hypothetical protein
MVKYLKKEDVEGLINDGIRAYDATLKTVSYKPTIRRLKVQKGFLEDLLADVSNLKTREAKAKKE